ncbi:hypothetical protein PR048_001273 [Dryococelus australis]|uniref:DDE-1 domain-containing protein n=1 Tax=Dryococelus australis TaxID=614101 RepID=A0ABQ9IGZ6_9NEOP|nr:hypothetical protein PR048_001273 [Dryococelus australis]
MPGGQPVFTQEQERKFVAHTIAMSKYGFPVTTFDLGYVVKSYLNSTGKRVKCFTNNLPGRDWVDAFMKRHCKKHQVYCTIALPSNSTHILQPLDVAFFRIYWRKVLSEWKGSDAESLCTFILKKIHWRKVLSEWKGSVAESLCTYILKEQFPTLLKKLMATLETGTSTNLWSGFHKTGIHPLDKYQVLRRLLSAVLQNDLSGTSDVIGDTFMDHLQKKREETTAKRTIRRRKKLNVPTGKRIGSADLNTTLLPLPI